MPPTAPATQYAHVELDHKGVPILSGTTMKVIELVIERMAYGSSPEDVSITKVNKADSPSGEHHVHTIGLVSERSYPFSPLLSILLFASSSAAFVGVTALCAAYLRARRLKIQRLI